MNKKFWIYTTIAGVLLVAFLTLTVLLTCVDVRPAGESGAEVGFATINEAVFDALGQFGDAPAALSAKFSGVCGVLMLTVMGAFCVTGLVQVIRRKGILRADKELYVMAGGLVLMAVAYVLFEIVVINCRPILEDGELAASYPSSHTMLATTVAGMGAAYLYRRFKHPFWNCSPSASLIGLAVIAVLLRLEAGVHWLTDIVGGVLLGLFITFVYLAVCALVTHKKESV